MTSVELTLGCARFLAGILAEQVESGTFTSDHAKAFYAGRLAEIQEAIGRAEAKAKAPVTHFACDGSGHHPGHQIHCNLCVSLLMQSACHQAKAGE